MNYPYKTQGVRYFYKNVPYYYVKVLSLQYKNLRYFPMIPIGRLLLIKKDLCAYDIFESTYYRKQYDETCTITLLEYSTTHNTKMHVTFIF